MCRNTNMIFTNGGLETRGFASHHLKKPTRKFDRISTLREMSSGQGFSSSSGRSCMSEGINKERSTGKAGNKRRRRSRPLVQQRGIKATDAETEASAVTEVAEQKEAENLNGSVDYPSGGKGGKGGALRTVRMRKFLPSKRRHKKGNRKDKEALKGHAEGTKEYEPLGASEATDIEEKGEVVQLSGAAAAREIVIAAAESSPWGNEKGKENKTGSEREAPTMGMSVADEEGNSTPRARKCPPAVGFVSGFRDIRLDEGAACSSSSGNEGVAVGGGKAGDGKIGPPGVEALIRALSEPLKSTPQRWHSGFSASANTLPIPAAKYQSEGVAEAKPSSSRQKTTKPQPDASQLYSGAIGARIDEQWRIDPPAKSVSIRFDPEADTPLSCITLNTDIFGEALHGPSVGNMSRTDVASYLEEWLLVSVKHGVAPRELQALFQETQGTARDFSVGKVSGRGDIDAEVGRKGGVGRWAYHGSWDRGRRNDEYAAGGSWTRYGWKRLNPPPGELETAEDCSSSCDDSGEETLAPTESEEEEMMETVAEALVGGGGGPLAEDWNIPNIASSQEMSEFSVFSDAPTVPDTDPPYLSSLERTATPGVAATGASHEGVETPLLGLRVLEAVEARFKSGLHPPRIIAIGDVHGCLEELKDLVRKVEYWPGDLLLFLGDLVSYGVSDGVMLRSEGECSCC